MTGSLVATALLLSTGLSVVKGQNSKESEPSNDGCIYRMWEGVQGSSIEAMMRDPMFLDRGGAPDVEEAFTDFFEAPTDICNNCASELIGYFKAPMDGKL
jgi:hypothetical protein